MKIQRLVLAGLGLTGVLAASVAGAKTFRNAYVSFELADRWNCNLEQTEWVCRTTTGPSDNREAIIILTAKEVGPSDSLPAYEAHLKTPRTIASRTGQPVQSQILKVEQRNINQHPWVDGMHMASEIPNYYTRYLATTKDKIAVLVTFSAHKSSYSRYSSDFFRAIESLRVIATKSLMGAGGSGVGIPGSDMLGSGNSGGGMGFGDELPAENAGGAGRGVSEKMKMALGLAALVAILGLYLLLRPKKKAKKKKNL